MIKHPNPPFHRFPTFCAKIVHIILTLPKIQQKSNKSIKINIFYTILTKNKKNLKTLKPRKSRTMHQKIFRFFFFCFFAIFKVYLSYIYLSFTLTFLFGFCEMKSRIKSHQKAPKGATMKQSQKHLYAQALKPCKPALNERERERVIP